MTPALRKVHAALEATGLRPILDPALERCVADCPACPRTHDYRPLEIGTHAGVQMYCRAGCSDTAVRRALDRGPVDWQTLCFQLHAIACDLSAALDRALAERPHLRAVA